MDNSNKNIHTLKYEIILESPVTFTSNIGDTNMVSTLEYIPGSALLGAFAWKYLKNRDGVNRDNAHLDKEFYNIFLNGGVKFTNAYPVDKISEDEEKPFVPTPVSFAKEKGDEEKLYDLMFRETNESESMKSAGGFYYAIDDQVYSISPSKKLNFHHQRNRLKGSSEEGLIFNYESLNPGQKFSGFLVGSKEELEELLDIENGKSFTLRLGRSRHTQYGRILFRFADGKPRSFESPIEEYGNVETADAGSFVLQLISPAIILNKYGFSEPSIDNLLNEMSRVLGVKVHINEDIDGDGPVFSKASDFTGYKSVWNMPSPSEYDFSAGSIFQLKINGGFNKEEINRKLLDIVRNGIGEKRGEGFGRVIIRTLSKIEEYQVIESDVEKEISKPSDNIPEQVKKILKGVVHKKYLAAVRKTAIENSASYIAGKTIIPNKTLLNRLITIIRQSGISGLNKEIKRIEKREKAKDQLEKCRDTISNNKITLFEHLENQDPFNIEHIKSVVSGSDEKLQQFYDEIYHIKRDTLKREYWLSFLRNMVKKARKEAV